MRRAGLMLLPLLALCLLAAGALASDPGTAGDPPALLTRTAITRAAIAPFADALRHDAAALCGDFLPAVAGELVRAQAGAVGCVAAADRQFALASTSEPPPNPDLSVQPTVRDLEIGGQRATLTLSFTFLTVTTTRGMTIGAFHAAGPIKLALEEVDGVWLVSSRATLATVPGCSLAQPRRCPQGARVVHFSAGELEPVLPAEALPSPVVPGLHGRRKQEVEAGKLDVAQSGCLACHRIGENGNRGPGPNLSHVGAKLSERRIAHALADPRAPMPSFSKLPRPKFHDIVRFLAALR